MTSLFTRAHTVFFLLTGMLAAFAPRAAAELKYTPIPTQYIAALGDASATRGTGAEDWGLWVVDPGPRGVRLTESAGFLAKGVAPAGWAFDSHDWWVEEYGRIMEKPSFPIPPGRYVVTNGKSMISILTVHEKDGAGHMAWEFANGATLISVTHLGCRAGRYRPQSAGAACTPASVATEQFPIAPGAAMPPVPQCSKQDYQVLIAIGMVAEGA